MQHFTLQATSRETQGSSASRRLRRASEVPAILYGDNKAATMIALNANELTKNLKVEAFYSQILTLKLNGTEETAILRALQRHPIQSNKILHADFQRINMNKEFKKSVPLHFIHEDTAVGVKEQGGIISHVLSKVEISCFPKHLPEFIEVDLSQLKLNEAIHLSNLKLPEHVKLAHAVTDKAHDHLVVSIHAPKVASEEPESTAAPVASEVAASKVKKADAAATASSDKKQGGVKDDKKDMKKAKDKK